MNTLKHIVDKWNIDLTQPLPIPIKISRFKTFGYTLKDLGFKVGAEIGVCTGRFSLSLLNNIPGLKLYGIDPWKSYSEYVENPVNQDRMEALYQRTKRRTAGYNCELIRKTSMDAVKDFKDNSLDFVFIDGNHSFKYVIEDIYEWSKKVRPGGIVAGHDYWDSYGVGKDLMLCQVRYAVDAWTAANKINPWFLCVGDLCPTFFWIKE